LNTNALNKVFIDLSIFYYLLLLIANYCHESLLIVHPVSLSTVEKSSDLKNKSPSNKPNMKLGLSLELSPHV